MYIYIYRERGGGSGGGEVEVELEFTAGVTSVPSPACDICGPVARYVPVRSA